MGGYFADEPTKEKLVILYFFDTTGFLLPRENTLTTLTNFMPDEYFSLASGLESLAKAGLLAMVARPSGQCYCISEHGRYTLRQFKERLPMSLRRSIDEYTKENREQIIKETEYLSNYERKSEKQYIAHLSIAEGGMVLMKLDVNVPSAKSAASICNRFVNTGPKVYRALFDTLFSD